MKNILSKIINLGVTEERQYFEQRRIRIFNKAIFVAIALTGLLIIINIIVWNIPAVLTITPFWCLFFSLFWFISKQWHDLAQVSLVVLASLFVTNQLLLFGPEIHLEPMYVVIVVATLFIEGFRLRASLFLFVGCCYVIFRIAPLYYETPFSVKDYAFKEDIHLWISIVIIASIVSSIVQELKKDAEILEKQNVALFKKNAELEHFAYIASHDLKTPVQNMQNFLGLIDENIQKKKYTELPVFIRFAKDSSQRMMNLINDLLRYSRIKNEKGSQTIEDLNEILETVKLNLESVIVKENAIIKSDNLPHYVVNKSQFIMLFQNLIENGIKYNTSTQPQIQIHYQENSKHVELSFQDNGIGIESQFYDKIFDMFQRLHTIKEYPGTGIGLAMCKKVVEEHNGSIHIESKQGIGSCFTIKLPIKS